jgi:hypothetical protein
VADKKKPKYDRGPSPFPWRGLLCLTGWHGYSETTVLVVGTTEHKWRIEALEPTQLVGKKVLEKGKRALVPHRAVRTPREAEPPQQVLDLRQAALPFAAELACPECDYGALRGVGKCDRHATRASSGKHSSLERRKSVKGSEDV